MKVLGLIVEYNPFHNGHIYHIQQAKKLVEPDYTIAIMSSSFVQRGEPAIIDKWKRAQIAIQYGIDLIVELPFVYATQSADYFAKGAMMILNALGVTHLCFGSEQGECEPFIHIANTLLKHQDTYDTYVKEYIKQGLRYPDATNKALIKLVGYQITTPNDLLGLSYVKEIIFNNYPIEPLCIKRTNNYHGTTLSFVASATALRQAIKTKQPYAHALVHEEYYQDELYFMEDFYPYLAHVIYTSSLEELKSYHLVEEGMEYSLKKHIKDSNSMDEFISKLVTKRYTRPRISRMLIHVLMRNRKQDINEALNIDYIHVLAMNPTGRHYLKLIKKTCPYHIMTRFASHQHIALQIEEKATAVLSLLSKDNLVLKEYSWIPYITH